MGHQAYQTNAVETASPEQLTLMCYDGTLKFMRRAVKACEDGDMGRFSEFIGRAQAIVNELNVTLNMEAGGEISTNLREIYLFINRHMAQAVVQRDTTMILQCMDLIQGIRDSWAEAMNVGAAAA